MRKVLCLFLFVSASYSFCGTDEISMTQELVDSRSLTKLLNYQQGMKKREHIKQLCMAEIRWSRIPAHCYKTQPGMDKRALLDGQCLKQVEKTNQVSELSRARPWIPKDSPCYGVLTQKLELLNYKLQ